ncbi:protein MFA1 [Kluyveromyces marxianus]|uniref:Protein MFA1 n=1 Tax=Kluyveromyces marxianus TaxID=4911 RepID=A0ABX6F195_KLUMA|nr:protein MFA1 [Kluyveromyces marxianus]
MQPTTQTQVSQEDSSENKENWIIPGFVQVPQCVIV